MMQVRLLCARATATDSQRRGDVIDVPQDEAERMFAGLIAEPIAAKNKPVESATVEPPENMENAPKPQRRTNRKRRTKK